MSIYCSRVTVGEQDDPDSRGRVIAHPDNDLRQIDDPRWPAGVVMTAHIPVWCVPGHQVEESGEYDDEPCSEWLRLSVAAGADWLDVLIDESAALALASDLLAWALKPKVASAAASADDPGKQGKRG